MLPRAVLPALGNAFLGHDALAHLAQIACGLAQKVLGPADLRPLSQGHQIILDFRAVDIMSPNVAVPPSTLGRSLPIF